MSDEDQKQAEGTEQEAQAESIGTTEAAAEETSEGNTEGTSEAQGEQANG